MKKLLLLFLIFSALGLAQNGGSWTPQTIFAGDTLNIYFDATLNDGGLAGSSTMTLHWGVNEQGSGSWQIPDSAVWPEGTVQSGTGAVRSPMLANGTDKWKIQIVTNSSVSTLHFVFNNGNKWAHSTDGENWNLVIYKGGVTAEFFTPEASVDYGDPARSPVFTNSGDSILISGGAVIQGPALDSLFLFVNGTQAVETDNDTILFRYYANSYSKGMNAVYLVAKNINGDADTAQLAIMNNLPVLETVLPAGIKPGINYIDENSVILALFAPYKNYTYVIGDFNDWKVDSTYYMKKYAPTVDSTVWWLEIDSLTSGEEYAFQYLVDGNLRIADPYTHKVLNPWNDKYISETVYPNLKPYPENKTDQPVGVLQIDQNSFNWQYNGSYQRPMKEKLVIYELLIRDFVADHSYQTLVDTLDYLKNLGITAIELMPVNEFEGNESWGYNPSFYFAPDKYYGTTEALKTFIDQCHRRNIAVILDMVLNHSFGQSPMVRLYWDAANNRPASNSPWFNQQATHPYSVGYDFNHESRDTKYFVDRVNKYWLQEFNVDGFRFDLSKGFTQRVSGDNVGLWGQLDNTRIAILQRMFNKIREVDGSAYVILEHFADNSEEQILSNLGMLLWGNLNYNYNEASMGYTSAGNSNFHWGYYKDRSWSQPNLVTFMESHDEERLMYKNLRWGNGSSSYKITDLNNALERQKLVAAFFLTIPGPRMIWQFGELGYDVSIFADRNGVVPEPYGTDSHKLDNKPIRWNYLQENDRNRLYRTFSALNKLRAEEAIFTSASTSVTQTLSGAFKRLKLTNGDVNVVVLGNFDVNAGNLTPSFQSNGTRYDFFSGESFEVSDVNATISFKPGEFHIYSDKKFFTPDSDIVTGISTEFVFEQPYRYQLQAAYPNPFNPATTIPFTLAKAGKTELIVYNIMGQKIVTLTNKNYLAGTHEVVWNGSDMSGRQVASGVYFVRLKSADFNQTKKLILMK